MKLALYLPNFRNKVTVKELEDLTSLAEELDFDSVWTLDRIVVPEASDRVELQYSFGMMPEFPKALPVSSRGEWFQGWPLIPWLAAKTSKVRIGMSICDTPYRAPGVLAAELATVDHLSNGRLNVGVGPAGCPRSSRPRAPRTSTPSGTSSCARRSRSCRASGRTTCSSTTASSPTSTGAGSAGSRCRSRTRRSTSAGSRTRLARRAASRSTTSSGWIGIQDTPEELQQWRGAIQQELGKLESSRSIDDLDIGSMIWYTITDQETDQTPLGKGSNLLVGTAAQVTDNLKRLKEAGLNLLLIWPPFADVPVSKTLDDLKRLKEEIMPKVEAI